jgi:hypothetical protein
MAPVRMVVLVPVRRFAVLGHAGDLVHGLVQPFGQRGGSAHDFRS